MDDELKQALGQISQRLDVFETRFDQFETRFDQFETRFDQVDKRFDDTNERISDTETKLLTAFYDWARPVETRVNKQLPAIDERLGWLEARVAQLERRNLERGN
jgi:predicted  nucleic acid-binding Zn-ribbon protein